MDNNNNNINRNNEKLILLGSTGSIGRQTVEVCKNLGIQITAIAASSNIKLLEEQIRAFSPAFCAVTNEKAAAELKIAVADTAVKILSGPDSPRALISLAEGGRVLNAITGFAGLASTLETIKCRKTLLLANKESLVAAGNMVMSAAREAGVKVLPVDSEHCAIWQCLDGRNKPSRLILTASGGPFFGMKRDKLEKITPEDALSHPTWNMGPKITIDSASLMNKGLEVIEAAHLFDMPGDKIDVVVHRQSIIHSMVEYDDMAVIAQLSKPDMRLCIQYALTYPQRTHSLTPKLDLTKIASLTFDEPDMETFTLLPLAYRALDQGGVFPVSLNAANEAAVSLFFDRKLSFAGIFDTVEKAMADVPVIASPTLDDIISADSLAREKTAASVK